METSELAGAKRETQESTTKDFAMPCFGKSEEVIANRRDVKRAATNHIITLARRFPRSAHMGNSIDEEALMLASVPIQAWWETLSVADKTVLRTAKGCTRKPAGAPPHGCAAGARSMRPAGGQLLTFARVRY